MKAHIFSSRLILIALILAVASCTKVVVRAEETKTAPVIKKFSADIGSVYQKSREVLNQLGYSLLNADDTTQVLETRWMPTTSDSHYLPLFGRRDYSANQGGYYKLVITAEIQGNYVGVTTYTVLKSVAGKLESSEVVEKRFLKKLGDALRHAQIEVNNVGMEEK